MRDALAAHAWPAARLDELLSILGHRAHLALGDTEPQPVTRAVIDAGASTIERWIEATCDCMGFEAEPIEVAYRDVDATLRAIAPAVIRLPGDETRFIGLLPGRGGQPKVIGLDHHNHRIALDELRSALCAKLEARVAPTLARIASQIDEHKRAHAVPALQRELIGATRIGGLVMLRMSPGAPAARQIRNSGLGRRLAAVVVGHALQYLAWLASWWMLGRGALAGHLDLGWIIAWALLLLSSQAIRIAMLRAEGRLAIDAGAMLKQRLLLGTLRVPPDHVRAEGVGQLLGRVLESEAVESLALGGGLTTLEAIMELAAAPVILWLGAGGGIHVALLAVTLAATAAFAVRYYRKRLAWTDARIAMTNALVESMVGHRTRIVQQPAADWSHGADHALEDYLERGARMDREAVRFRAVVPRGWLLLGIAALAPAFVAGTASPGELALALGGVLLAMRALTRLSLALVQLTDAAISFRQIAMLYRAASERDSIGVPGFAVAPGAAASVVEAHDVSFRYDSRTEPALRGVSLKIAPGDRVLLEGPSGGGKSTLAAVLSGLRVAQQGVLLLGGLDRATLGIDGWRRRIATAPQFHENHVLAETFAFNLLMGRTWPPDANDLADAHAICSELGLDPLLERMPAGMLQMVGDTGWQLSHGERSRVFIARALLQRAELLIFDESFGALDPENVQRALECVLKRAGAVVVIAHP